MGTLPQNIPYDGGVSPAYTERNATIPVAGANLKVLSWECVRHGHVVHFQCTLVAFGAVTIGSTDATLCTIESRYRPLHAVTNLVIEHQAGALGVTEQETDGAVTAAGVVSSGATTFTNEAAAGDHIYIRGTWVSRP